MNIGIGIEGTGMNAIAASAAKSSPGMVGAVLQNGPMQTGIGVSVITLVAQVFAREEVQAVVTIPAIAVALVTALLIAFHHVRFVQRVSTAECIVLIPLSTLILFAMALGANNLVGANTGTATATEVERVEDNLARNRDLQEELLAARADDPATTAASARFRVPPETYLSRYRAEAAPARETGGGHDDGARAAELARLKQQEQELLRLQEELQRRENRLWKSW